MASSYPHFTVDWETGKGQILGEMTFYTPITGAFAKDQFIALSTNGILVIEPGYVWDFGSGPAIDTPDMVMASLAHDAFYDLMNQGKLSWSYRKAADTYFKQLLKKAGMSWFRRQYVYLAVRYGYPLVKRFL